MSSAMRMLPIAAVALLAATGPRVAASASPVPVRHGEEATRRVLTLRSLDGADLASGEQTQTLADDRVTSRLVFRFKDGSLHDETTVFSQRGTFRVISDHLIQSGKAFPTPLDVMIDRGRSEVVTKYRDGTDKTDIQHMTLPEDLANGIIPTLLKNVRPSDGPVVFSLMAATPKPRLVKLSIRVGGTETLSMAASADPVTRFIIHVDIGGLSGMLAPMVGKQPPDSTVWIAPGAVPVFVRTEAQLFVGGPLWRIDVAR